jgi:two-component system OmpR family response regulator
MLPDCDGLEVARRLRSEGRDPGILFLTALDSIEDRVAGLRLGGDDYLTKPFSLEEVVARVQAILRRVRPSSNQQALLRVADLVMDTHTHEVWRGDVSVHLTATEFALLRYFMVNPRRVLSKSQILSAVWHGDFDVDENVVETYVSYLRKKLHRHGPPMIDTVRLVGYALRPVAA